MSLMGSHVHGWFDRAAVTGAGVCLRSTLSSLLFLAGCADVTSQTEPQPQEANQAESASVASESQPSVAPPDDEPEVAVDPVPADPDEAEEPAVQAAADVALDPNDGPAVGRWLAERQWQARDGSAERVRMPLVFTNDAWGAAPLNFVGGDPVSHNGGPTWVLAELSPGLEYPERPTLDLGDGLEMEDSMIVLVEGQFTGETVIRDMREEPDSPEEGSYHYYRLAKFEVTRVLGLLDPTDVPSPEILEPPPPR